MSSTRKPSTYEGNEPFIIISYSGKDGDREKVFRFIDDWQQKGYRIWYDKNAGRVNSWQKEFAEHIEKENCRYCFAFLCENFKNSHNCLLELTYCYDLMREYVGIDLEKVKLEGQLGILFAGRTPIPWYDYSKDEIEEFYMDLEDFLGEDIELCRASQDENEESGTFEKAQVTNRKACESEQSDSEKEYELQQQDVNFVNESGIEYNVQQDANLDIITTNDAEKIKELAKDRKEVEHLQRMVKKDDSNAQKNLGILYENGWGGYTKNLPMAKFLYIKASNGGNKYAKERLEQFNG